MKGYSIDARAPKFGFSLYTTRFGEDAVASRVKTLLDEGFTEISIKEMSSE